MPKPDCEGCWDYATDICETCRSNRSGKPAPHDYVCPACKGHGVSELQCIPKLCARCGGKGYISVINY